MQTVMESIARHKVVPVIKIDDVNCAKPLAEALIGGGLPIAEVTFRTACAAEAIAQLRGYPEILLGAGSVLTADQARRACDAGARFLVSAGISRRVIEFAIDNRVPVFPGIATPSELITVMEYGIPVVKFFPAEQFGGVAALKALSGPFPDMKFMPTGGISAANLRVYLAFSKVIACGGSWMVRDSLLHSGDFAQIEELVRETVALAAM